MKSVLVYIVCVKESELFSFQAICKLLTPTTIQNIISYPPPNPICFSTEIASDVTLTTINTASLTPNANEYPKSFEFD